MNRKTTLRLLALALLLAASVAAADGRQDVLFRWDVRLWGGDAAWGYRGWRLFQGVDTVLWGSAGAGWQSANYFDEDDDEIAPSAEPGYSMLAADWRLGLAQGILFNPDQDRNLLEALLLYRGKYQHYRDGATLAGLPDENGILQNSILAGVVFDNHLEQEEFKTREGLYSALTLELVPRWLGNDLLGDSHYARLAFVAAGYLPVYESRPVSVYLADRLLLDCLLGERASIPVSATGTFGALTEVPIGSNPLRALGGELRGVAGERYDGLAKAVNNFDLRLHFPALTLFDALTPGVTFYFDAGVYDRMTRRLRFDPVYASAGAGVALYALGFDFLLYGDYFINEGDFSVSLGMGAHF